MRGPSINLTRAALHPPDRSWWSDADRIQFTARCAQEWETRMRYSLFGTELYAKPRRVEDVVEVNV
jgi:hypothetical protein